MKKFFLVAAFVLLNSATQALGQEAPSATETEAMSFLSQVQDLDMMRMNILPSIKGRDILLPAKKTGTITVVNARFSQWGKDESYKIYDFAIISGRWEPRVVFRDYFSRDPHRAEKEITFGGGYRFLNKDSFVLTQDALISHAWNKYEQVTFFQPTTRAVASIGSRVTLDFAFFPYVPLFGHGKLQLVNERSRANFKVNSLLSLAGGWGATELPGEWQHGKSWGATFTPFQGKIGNFEVVYQGGRKANQGGWQFNYTVSGVPHLHHKKK